MIEYFLIFFKVFSYISLFSALLLWSYNIYKNKKYHKLYDKVHTVYSNLNKKYFIKSFKDYYYNLSFVMTFSIGLWLISFVMLQLVSFFKKQTFIEINSAEIALNLYILLITANIAVLVLTCFWVYKKGYYFPEKNPFNFDATAVLFLIFFFIVLIHNSLKITLCLFLTVEYFNLQCFLYSIVWGTFLLIIYLNVYLFMVLFLITHSGGFRCQDNVLVAGYRCSRFLRKLKIDAYNPLFLLSNVIFIILELIYSRKLSWDAFFVSLNFINCNLERTSDQYEKRYILNITIIFFIIGAIFSIPKIFYYHNNKIFLQLFYNYKIKKEYFYLYKSSISGHPIVCPVGGGPCVVITKAHFNYTNPFFRCGLLIPKNGKIIMERQYIMNVIVNSKHILLGKEVTTVSQHILRQVYHLRHKVKKDSK